MTDFAILAAIGWRQIAKLTENVPLTLWTLDALAKTLMANYRETDVVTKQLVPLRYFYLPAYNNREVSFVSAKFMHGF